MVGIIVGGLSLGSVLASVNGQYSTFQSTQNIELPESQLVPNLVSKDTRVVRVATNPVLNVPKGLYIAHVATDKGNIDVQRFIDPTTNVACYYSLVTFTNQVLSNCVLVSSSAQ